MIIGFKIKLDTIEKIKNFSSSILTFENDIDIMQGKYVINAKSIIAIFSLDLTKIIKVIIHDATIEDVSRLENVLKEFRVDEDKNN